MRWYHTLLYPFSVVYDFATALRNHLFDIGYKKEMNFDVPTVVVGNLSVGGSGKTPMVEFLIESLTEKYRLAVLSRGYGRKTRGFIMLQDGLSPEQVGDEPFQIFSKYGKNIKVAVGEQRTLAIPKIMLQYPDTALILLDDAFQHRYLRADYNILLTTFHSPFFRDHVLPMGLLRESRSGARRANLVIVTKCPDNLGEELKALYIGEIKKYTNAKTIFTSIQYGEPYSVLDNGKQIKQKVVLVSGIANDALFVNECQSRFQVIEKFTFGDHHTYSDSDMKKITSVLKEMPDSMLLTTEKDAVKLKNPSFRDYLAEFPIFAMPIKINMSAQDQNALRKELSDMVSAKAYHQ
ncbi:tetraacyldisaccharide 4'-kinase [Arthrospiribacter ruber]|uniref:Tetraacyldisaccharide 4'-kinase n=1 Tax=Arthrospiribacter ruber TaxID=2487934 RepID=A0A951IQJ0_9BACT|nr:tetraacyldisaccharide 4'-kinase [Arthrospiribacter ruber]MBW3466475.1 tetraacyldisaccharide 4'-kinase [Arthrospiribacter ruber]